MPLLNTPYERQNIAMIPNICSQVKKTEVFPYSVAESSLVYNGVEIYAIPVVTKLEKKKAIEAFTPFDRFFRLVPIFIQSFHSQFINNSKLIKKSFCVVPIIVTIKS